MVDARSDKRRKTGTDRITLSRSSSRGRQAPTPVNNQKEVSVAPSEDEALESKNFEFTKEEVDALMNESFRSEKSDSKV
ncbi:hypothetical protein M8C21_018152 [Ambrosia artemisiifolia]|uniref:Uncharacterized protein n=1 Tax=Ambrosia artemisiifolia TaxID=4212 RepID=A0AAD5BLQ2_AMBAR|nr:hypothetical protein M8C21_018152 [Ambrosia artemisiifolia]